MTMDRARFSFIAHRHLTFCNPISEAKIERAMGLMGLRPGDSVIDWGAGKCELLIRLVRRYGVRGVGVELAGLFASEARRRTVESGVAAEVVVHEGDAREYLAGMGERRFDLSVCVGSTHSFGDYGAALGAMHGTTRPGGLIFVGEGYWKQPPSKEYLRALGGEESESRTHAENVGLAAARGLVPLWAGTASDDEWDEYEWGYARGIETFVAGHPSDPDAPAMLERSRGWRETYLKWGRETLGFGLYLFRAPG